MPTDMKLSELVKIKETLERDVSSVAANDAINGLRRAFAQLNTTAIDSDLSEQLQISVTSCEQALKLIDHAVNQLPTIYTAINGKINDLSAKYFAANYHMELSLDEEGERRTRDKAFSDDARRQLTMRLRLYSDWHYPGLEIGPGAGVWTNELVGNDPLYLVDIRKSYLDETLAKYTPEYQRRLRPYLLDWEAPRPDLSVLPQNQFGFVVSINVFEYFSFDQIRSWLEEVYKILKPGGVFLFTYNNGERSACAQLVENGTVSYIPKTLLTTFCETHGYEVIETFDLDYTVCWIEIRKPGTLKTVKAHQAMGEIKSKSS